MIVEKADPRTDRGLASLAGREAMPVLLPRADDTPPHIRPSLAGSPAEQSEKGRFVWTVA